MAKSISSRSRSSKDSTDDIMMKLKEFYIAKDNHSVASTVSSASASTIKQIRKYIQEEIDDSGSIQDDASTVVTKIVEKRPQPSKSKRDSAKKLLDSKRTKSRSSSNSLTSEPIDSREMNQKIRRASSKDERSVEENKLQKKKESKSADTASTEMWEKKLKKLALLLDEEKKNTDKLSEIEKVLDDKKVKLKADIEVAKWMSKIQKMESLLDEKRKEKNQKLLKLTETLEELKEEKKEMKKYSSSSKPKSYSLLPSFGSRRNKSR